LSFQFRSVWRMRLGGHKAVLVRTIAKLATNCQLLAK
jgi:hypothetical protein